MQNNPATVDDRTQSPRANEFRDKLLAGVFRGCFDFQANNFDRERFPEKPIRGPKQRLKDTVLSLARRAGFARRRFQLDKAAQTLGYIIRQNDRYQQFYESLANHESRELLIDLLRFRVLGPEHVRLPLNTPQYQRLRASIAARYLREPATMRGERWTLNRYEIDRPNGKLQLHLHSYGFCTTFLLDHYAYRSSRETVEAEPGDIVIDGGGCWGDTALYFAEKTAPAGRVYCLEFDPANLEVFKANLQLNPRLSERVHILEKALWDHSGEAIPYTASGPGTMLQEAGASANSTVTTMTIDDLAAQHQLARVDFIKMDIEGAELRALRGAEKVIRRFRPKLAISLYHKPDDFLEIPEYLRSLDLGYRFLLGHVTIHSEETVLFATTKESARTA